MDLGEFQRLIEQTGRWSRVDIRESDEATVTVEVTPLPLALPAKDVSDHVFTLLSQNHQLATVVVPRPPNGDYLDLARQLDLVRPEPRRLA